MRDRRFVAMHRGGPLDRESHALLARWATDCAEAVLHYFASESRDDRPRHALEVARAWAAGTVKTGVAMKAAVAAHAAARSVEGRAAIAAARAAGHAVATAHAADHSMGGLLYALKAIEASGGDWGTEMERQLTKLPGRLREMVAEGVAWRLEKLGLGRHASRKRTPRQGGEPQVF